jgi:hypothetical protein
VANFLESLTKILQNSIEGEPPPPAKLLTISDRLDELTAVSIDASGAGIDRWLRALRNITGDQELYDTLIARALQMHFPRAAEALTALGLIDFKWADDGTLSAFLLDWEGLDAFLTDPGKEAFILILSKLQKIKDVKAAQALVLLFISGPRALLALEYQRQGFAALPVEGDPGISLRELIELVNSPLFLKLPLSTFPLDLDQFKMQAEQTQPPNSSSIMLDGPGVGPDNNDDPANGTDGLAVDILLKQGEALPPVDLGDGWLLKRTADTGADKHYRLKFKPADLDPNTSSDGEFILSLSRKTADPDAFLLGDKNGTHFAVQNVELGLRFRPNPLYDLVVRLDDVRFVLKPDFLKLLSFGLELPALLRFNSDIAFDYVQGKGLSAQGSAEGMPALGVQFAAPLNLTIGSSAVGLRVDTVVTRLEASLHEGDLQFRIQFRYSARGRFGPLGVILDGAGVSFGRWGDGFGGPLAPQGIGLDVSAGPVSGGGFLKTTDGREFSGALQLKILGIGAFAYGLYKTLPNGEPAVVALIGIRFPMPGIQIGFGFAVTGFGGLIGVNRRADTDLLRERLASGTAGNVLFNDNPMRNAPQLLNEMGRFFPDDPGIFLIGPTLQVNWLYILKLDLGIFIELPGPRQVFIAGSARLVIGSEEFALVYLRLDFIGGLDLTKSLIYFDAALVNSHVLGIFRITGGVALRIGYGVGGYFLFSVGGFHPDFHPAGLELPRLARVGVGASFGPAWLKMEMYLALTSSSFQLGFKVEAGLDLGPLSAHGWFRFDALIQLKPFAFMARIDAGFDIEALGFSFCSARVEGYLSGPGPLVLNARASVSRFGLKASGSITLTLSNNPPQQVVPISNLPQYLQEELNKADNLRFEGDDRSVVFAPADPGLKLYAPVGVLVWEQKRVPLNLDIQKAEGVELGGWHRLSLEVSDPTGEKAIWTSTPEMDWFGAGTYLILNDSEALNLSRLEEQESGLRINAGSDMAKGRSQSPTLKLNMIRIPGRILLSDAVAGLFGITAMISMLNQRDGRAQPDPGPAGVIIKQETWNVHNGAGMVAGSAPNSVQAFSEAKRIGGTSIPAVQEAVNLEGVF